MLRAEQALLRVLHDEPADYEARRMLATVYLSEHRFRDAIREAGRARDERPRDDWNYGVMGDGHLELGEYDEAFASFKQMMDLRPTAAAYARVSYALELQGKLDAAIEAMRLSTDATPPTDLESIAWHHAQLGDLHREAGRLDRAAIEYAWAEHAFPGHPFADLGGARLAEAKGDLVTALAAYEKVSATAPTPDVHARLGELYDRLGRTMTRHGNTRWPKPAGGPMRRSLRRWRAFSRSGVRKWTRRCVLPRARPRIGATSSPRMRWRGATSRPAV